MNQRRFFILFLPLALIISACGSSIISESTPVPPTEPDGEQIVVLTESEVQEIQEEEMQRDETMDSEGSAEIEVSAATNDSLTGVIWTLTKLNGQPPINKSNITASFSEDGTVAGSAGCNNYAASFEVDGNQIHFGLGPMTQKMCLDQIMTQEAAYMAALEGAATFEVTGDSLVLFDKDFNASALFKAVSQELAGSSWNVISYNNGKGGVTSLISGTLLTADFDKEGQLTGNAGCNNYFGTYLVDGENLSMGPFGTTRKACPEPEGIMEQEAQFLAALESVATYKIDGLTMNMRRADGATAANFQRIVSPEEEPQPDGDSPITKAAVSGLVTFQGDPAIPSGAILTIQIQDTSRADAMAEVIGEQRIENPGQFPVDYHVTYDPSKILDNHSYTMSARLTADDGALLFINDTAIPVITRDAPTVNVEIPVIQIGG